MRFNNEEKKILFAFGRLCCRNTVEQLKWLAALAVDAETKQMILMIAKKLDNEGAENWCYCFNQCLRIEMAGYFLARKAMHMAEKSTDGKDMYDPTD